MRRGVTLKAVRLLCAAAWLATAGWAQNPRATPGGEDRGVYGPPVCEAAGHAASSGHSADYRAANEKAASEAQAGVADPGFLLTAEPENIALVRNRLLGYGECQTGFGCYWADVDAQYRRAEEALRVEAARAPHGEKLALVMDIDETTLTNWCEMKREDFGYIASLYGAWEVSEASATPIAGALRLVRAAQARGVAVFFITGRPGRQEPGSGKQDETAATERNLRAAGFSGWTGLALRNGRENGMPTIAYKSGERRKIVERGYRIVMSVGDQWSDLEGEPKAAVSVKLPNPFYFIP